MPVVAQTARTVRLASGRGTSSGWLPPPSSRVCQSSTWLEPPERTGASAWRHCSPACGARISRQGSSMAVSVLAGSDGLGVIIGTPVTPPTAPSSGRWVVTSISRRLIVASAAAPPRCSSTVWRSPNDCSVAGCQRAEAVRESPATAARPAFAVPNAGHGRTTRRPGRGLAVSGTRIFSVRIAPSRPSSV